MNEEEQLDPSLKKGPISWMARNRVAANLVLAIFIIGGLLMGLRVKQEVFPEIDLDYVMVTVPYPGASPAEVEQGIILAVEDETRGLDGVKQVTSVAGEGSGSVFIELLTGQDANKALQDVKNAIDRIQSFPEEAERPTVSLLDTRVHVISLILYGDYDDRTLRLAAENMRDELLAFDEVTLVELEAVKPLEIAIEVPQQNLRSYDLTLDQVASIVGKTSLELPGGGIKTAQGEFLLRTDERREFASEFEDITILSHPSGSRVVLSDMAKVIDGFEDTDQEAFFNGKKAVKIDVFRVGDQTPLTVAERVNSYVEEAKLRLPEGMGLSTWDDSSEIFRDRINLLLKNAFLGLILVLGLLGLFLEPRLAFWVVLGIPTSIIGSFLFIPMSGASINMISLFAFIVTLGIIVDDAVVIGEVIYQKRESGMGYLQSAIVGAREISAPVCFAVLTNIAAFLPLFFVPGATGKLFLQIPAVVCSVFIISLFESLYVLPAHLSHRRKKTRFWKFLGAPRMWFNKMLHFFIHRIFDFKIKTVLKYRYITICFGLAVLIISVGLVLGQRLTFSYIPRVDSDLITAQAELAFGAPIENSRALQAKLVTAAQEILEDEGDIARGIYTQIGSYLPGQGPAQMDPNLSRGSHIIGVQIYLVNPDKRNISGVEFARRWREKVGDIVGTKTLQYDATIQAAGGKPIDVQLSHQRRETLEQAATELATLLKDYNGVGDIDNGVSLGKPQYNFSLNPEGRALGLTTADLASQVRASFYGAEALRQQRGRNEVKVQVRLPEAERESIYTVEDLILRTPQGGEIPLIEAADIDLGRAYTEINRTKGRRVIAVTADVDESVGNANQIVSDLKNKLLPDLQVKYPGLSFSFEGQQKEQRESLDALKTGFLIALIIIFALLAIPFKSYTQPLIVMLAIPFGIVGALIGHLLLGYELSIISMFGIIALAGVVVNDSLVLVVTANRNRREHKMNSFDALVDAAKNRFRPIMLTSLTTFFGLTPMIFETSMQARFLIPMAISLGFGILIATGIILLIVPSAYLILEDLRKLLGFEDELLAG